MKIQSLKNISNISSCREATFRLAERLVFATSLMFFVCMSLSVSTNEIQSTLRINENKGNSYINWISFVRKDRRTDRQTDRQTNILKRVVKTSRLAKPLKRFPRGNKIKMKNILKRQLHKKTTQLYEILHTLNSFQIPIPILPHPFPISLVKDWLSFVAFTMFQNSDTTFDFCCDGLN